MANPKDFRQQSRVQAARERHVKVSEAQSDREEYWYLMMLANQATQNQLPGILRSLLEKDKDTLCHNLDIEPHQVSFLQGRIQVIENLIDDFEASAAHVARAQDKRAAAG